jgi:lipoprotein signal peptidase
VGNGIDRWRHGAVVDFLEFVPIHFPIFNLADVAINLAVASEASICRVLRPRRRKLMPRFQCGSTCRLRPARLRV